MKTLNNTAMGLRDFVDYRPDGVAVVTARNGKLDSDYWHLSDYTLTSRIGSTAYLVPKLTPNQPLPTLAGHNS